MAAPTTLRVVGRDGCPQCEVMCAVLGDRDIEYTYEKLTDKGDREEALRKAGNATFPLVYFGDEYIGNTDFAPWLMREVEEGEEVEVADLVKRWKGRKAK